MAHNNEYMLSGLERELALYEGIEYEDSGAGTTKDYKWKDKRDIERVTRMVIRNDHTATIDVPQYYSDDDSLIPAATNEFKNIEKSADGTKIYANPKGGLQQLWLVRITTLSDGENSKIQIDKRAPGGNWKSHGDPTQINQSTATTMIDWVKALSNIPTRTNDLEMEFGYEYEFDDDEFEYENKFELEYELDALENEDVTDAFDHRLHELSMRSFESEFELDMELESALGTMENEFMVKRLRRKKKRGKRKGLFKKILSTGAKIAGKVVGKTPIGSLIKAGTSLVRGNVKGALGNLAKAAVGTALGPVAGTVATTAIDALGGQEGEVRRRRRKSRAIRRVARIARDTYREVADTLPEDFDHPLTAKEVARKAVRKAMIKHGAKPPARAAAASSPQRIIRLKPGEKIVVVRS